MSPARLIRRVVVSALLASVASLAWADAKSSGSNYVPMRGQAGKDVIWIPTPEGLIDKMLKAAKVTPVDRVYDLGAGDGIIAITAARKFGADAVGIEYNPQMADFARRKVAEAGVADKVRIITGDIFKEDFSSATVVTLYLMPYLNLRLRPTILAMKPGTRVVSHAFNMGEWEPDETMSDESSRAFLWIVPAPVEGNWVLNGLDGGPVQLSFKQSFQYIGGTLTRGGVSLPLVGARLNGDDLSFKWTTADQQVMTFRGRVEGKQIRGTVESLSTSLSVEGRRL